MHKHKLLRAASAVALIAAMSTTAVSQSGGGSSGGGSSGGGSAPTQGQQTQGQQRMPDASPGSSGEREQGTRPMERSQDKAAPKSQVQGERDTPRASDRAQDKASPKSRVQGQGETPKSSDRAQEKSSPKSSVGERRGDDDSRRSAGDRDKDGKDNQRQSRERDTDRGDKQRQSDDRGKDRSKGMTDRGQKDGDRTRQGEADRERRGGGERVQLSQQQRTQVQDRLRQSGRSNRITNVNFDIRVGASVPRSVTLVALPPDIVQIVPEYRGYQYVYAGEAILIVDPNDYTVIAVLGSGPQTARRSGGRLTVSSDDRVFIRSHVDLAPAIRLGIGGISIGMSLPTDVELRPLPETVWQRVPDLRDHRYFVYENEIVIVEPQSREVVLVLED